MSACILLLEDVPMDAELIQANLQAGGIDCDLIRVDTREAFLAALETTPPDLILADYALPVFDGLSALDLKQNICPEVPFILVSGVLGEELAIEVLKHGATDYVLKQRLERLVPTVQRALQETQERAGRKQAEAALHQAHAELEQRATELETTNQKLRIALEQLQAQEKEREQLLAREQTARTEAESVNRLKDEFLATLSHEIRTPLHAILGWTQLLQARKLHEAAVRQAFEIIHRNAKSLTQLIDDILDVSRIIRGKLRLNVGPTELVPVLHAAIETVRPAAAAKKIRIETNLDPAAGPVLADPGRLQQIVWNLLSNAVKFTPEEGYIEVRLEQLNSHVQIQVIDTGQGIAPDNLAHIFERFRQVDGSSTRAHAGLGLGLAIVRHLTELQGGTVSADSPGLGQGATFTVRFPVTLHYQTGSPRKSDEGASASSLVLEGLQVLVVDDDADARELLTLMLGEYGAQVTVAGTAKKGLEVLKCLQPDVLISDISMPGEDGYALIHQVRALTPDAGGQIPAVALTAYARTEDQERALSAGFQWHIPKPVEPSELVKVVATLTGHGTSRSV